MERIARSTAEVVCVQTEAERYLTKESGWDDLRDETPKRVEEQRRQERERLE